MLKNGSIQTFFISVSLAGARRTSISKAMWRNGIIDLCLKWEMEMMTSRLRATVSRVMQDRMPKMSSEWGSSVLLQEVLILGKQSSASSRASMSREGCCWALTALWCEVSVWFISSLPPLPYANSILSEGQSTIRQTEAHSAECRQAG